MREFSVDYQGRVFPCCNIFPRLKSNEKFVFGEVNKMSIFEIFSLELWAKWRKELFIKARKAPCISCKDGFFDTDLDNENERVKLLEILNIRE